MAHLISGTSHSLNEIFNGENDKVIIPDLQRDYCWGNPYSKDSEESLVSSFMESIFKLDKSSEITMGLIYGYYDDKLMPYHLQLCDGQQRLTTLFLIMGIINRKSGDNRYRKLLISDFELEEDDNEPHLLYGIRESSLYFLSDLTLHYFLDSKLSTDQIDKQPWFLNSYYKDPTITSIRRALHTIETYLEEYEDVNALGDFIISKLKFLFYDMKNRQNGEETFVVINTTGEPLSANQNIKPLIMMENTDYKRIVYKDNGENISYDTAHDWEEMETWFWQNRHRNDIDTSTEGMLAFLHCVRILESETELKWHQNYETSDNKFPLSIKMEQIWKWFIAYKRVYKLDYNRLYTENIQYPERTQHYTQGELYAILPTMVYCNKFPDAEDEHIQRIYHLFANMAKYRPFNRSSKNEAVRVPAFRSCQFIKDFENKDVLSLLDNTAFDEKNYKEDVIKLKFIQEYKYDNQKRIHIEELFAKAESLEIYEGQIATLVQWSNGSVEKLDFFFNRIYSLWGNPQLHDKIRQAILAFGIKGYPMETGNANHTLCTKTEWRKLFELQGDRIQEFLKEGDLDSIIERYKDPNSQYYPVINDISYLEFSLDKQIRLYPHGVIEIMSKTRASANFLSFHRGEVFPKDMIDMKKWDGFWVWSDGNDTVFNTRNMKYNITLDMKIIEEGYLIMAWLDRNPKKKSVKDDIMISLNFAEKGDHWEYCVIANPSDAKTKFIEITKSFVDKTSSNG